MIVKNINNDIKIVKGDCFKYLKKIPSKSVDLILTDPPYATTDIDWDKAINLKRLWKELKRIGKKNCNYIFTAAQPFTSDLVNSNKKWFKYEIIWEKSKAQHFAQAPYRVMSKHENILIFSRGGCAQNAKLRMKYNPQGVKECNRICKGKAGNHSQHRKKRQDQADYVQKVTNYPSSILKISNEGNTEHPTQKPIDLMIYLIKTYSDKGNLVIDPFAGSFTTGVACNILSRKFIGIEKLKKYFKIGKKRISSVKMKQSFL